MRRFLPLLLLLAACPEQSGLECPANTTLVGQYSLAFQAVHDAGECIAVTGDASSPLALDDAGVKGSTLCVAAGPDGGPSPQLLVPGKGARVLHLEEDGGFHYAQDGIQNRLCVCDSRIRETLDGFLLTSGPFALRPDGGLPAITGLNFTLIDQFTAAGSGCVCQMPCTATFAVTGTPF